MYVDAGSTRNDTSPRFNSKRLVPMTETGSYCLFCKKCSNRLSRHTLQSPSQFLEKVRRTTFLTTVRRVFPIDPPLSFWLQEGFYSVWSEVTSMLS